MSDTKLERVLIIDDDADYRKLIKTFINKLLPSVETIEYDPVVEGAPGDDFNWSDIDVLLLDYNLSIVGTTGLDILHKHHNKHSFPATVMLTGAGTEEIAVRALKTGIYEYQSKQSLTKDKLKQLITLAWEEKISSRKKRQEITQHNKSFSKEVFYENLENALAQKEMRRALIVIKPDYIDELEQLIGIIGRDSLINFIGKNSFEVFKLGACNPNITRISDTAIAIQIDIPENEETLEFNMQGLCKHLAQCTFKFSEEKYSFSISIGLIKLGVFNTTAAQLIRLANAAAKKARSIQGNSYYIWRETDSLLPEPTKPLHSENNAASGQTLNNDINAEKEKLQRELKAAEAAIQAELAANNKLETELKIAAEAKEKAETALEAASEAKEKAETEAKARAEQEVKEKAEAEAKARAEQEAKEKAEAEAKARAEQEAKEKAEAEAKARAEQEAKEKAEAEMKARVEQEAKEKAEAEVKARVEQEAKEKAKAEVKARVEQEAKEKAEAEVKARVEQEAKEKAEAEMKARVEQEAKEKAEAEMKVVKETKERLEAELKAMAEAKEKAEAEVKAVKETKERLEAELKTLTEVKIQSSTMKTANAEPNNNAVVEKSSSNTSVQTTEPAHADVEEQNNNDASNNSSKLSIQEVEIRIKELIDEKRIIQTYQPVMPMFDDDSNINLYKTGFKAIIDDDHEDEINEKLSDLSLFSTSLQQTINEWSLRQIFLRITETSTSTSKNNFLITVNEAWFTDITLFNWLQKILSQTKKYAPGESIVLNVPIDIYKKHQKRAKALIDTLHKSHDFRVCLSNIIALDCLAADCQLTLSNMLILHVNELPQLTEMLGPANNETEGDNEEAEKQNLLQHLESKGIRIVTFGIDDSTLLTDSITNGTNYAMGSFIGEVQDSLLESGTVESFDLT